MCALHCAQLLHTILHKTDLIIFPLALQTITFPMKSIWGKGGGRCGLIKWGRGDRNDSHEFHRDYPVITLVKPQLLWTNCLVLHVTARCCKHRLSVINLRSSTRCGEKAKRNHVRDKAEVGSSLIFEGTQMILKHSIGCVKTLVLAACELWWYWTELFQ